MIRRSTSWSAFRSAGADASSSQSSTLSKTRRRGSSRGAADAKIPECSCLLEQKQAVVVVPPTPPLKSCLSVGNNLAHLSASSNSSSPTAADRIKKRVNFHKIEIREHPRALGDNPSVSAGPALSLGWYSGEEEGHSSLELPVDDYEAARPKRREKHELVVPKAIRTQMLREHAGVSRSEMAAAQRETTKIKQSRRLNNTQRGGGGVTFVLEKVAERMRRSASDRQVKELMERAERAEKMRNQQHVAAAALPEQTVESEPSDCKVHHAVMSANIDKEVATRRGANEQSSDTASEEDEDEEEGALSF